MRLSGELTIDKSNALVKGQGRRSKIKVTVVQTNLIISGWQLEKVPYHFSRSSAKFQEYTSLKSIINMVSISAFLGDTSSLNSQEATQ